MRLVVDQTVPKPANVSSRPVVIWKEGQKVRYESPKHPDEPDCDERAVPLSQWALGFWDHYAPEKGIRLAG